MPSPSPTARASFLTPDTLHHFWKCSSCLRVPFDYNHQTWVVKAGSVVLKSMEPSRIHRFMIVEHFDQSCACFEIAVLHTLTITKPILVREIFPGSSCH